MLAKPSTSEDLDIIEYKAKFAICIKALEDEEESRMSKCTINTDEPRMSALMFRSMDDRTFWFQQFLHDCSNFDRKTLWPCFEKTLKSMGLHDVGLPTQADELGIQAFINRKMKDLRLYQADLARKYAAGGRAAAPKTDQTVAAESSKAEAERVIDGEEDLKDSEHEQNNVTYNVPQQLEAP